MGLGQVRLMQNSLLVCRHGIIQPALGAQDIAEVGVRHSEIGLQTDGLLKMLDCAVQIHPLMQCDAEIAVGQGVVRVKLDGPSICSDGFLQPPLGAQYLPKLRSLGGV